MRDACGQLLTYDSVEHMLKNRRYIGEYSYRDAVISDGIPAIVPRGLFGRIQAKLAKNKIASARHRAKDDYLLSAKLVCGH